MVIVCVRVCENHVPPICTPGFWQRNNAVWKE